MVAVRLMGGLGNQMFQYATGRSLAHNLNTSLTLDLQFYENTIDVDTPREYELGCFNINASILSKYRRPIEPQRIYAGKKGRLRHAHDMLLGRAWHIYREPHHHYDPELIKQPDATYMVGFWQSEKYFLNIREDLIKEFNNHDAVPNKLSKYINEIKTSNSVSLHVRRGDYISNKHANAFHGTKDFAYYRRALAPIEKKIKNPTIFVFSDDIDWCRKNLKFRHNMNFVQGSVKGSDDLRLMALCKHNVIANSSFSWWGAWLNTNPKKIVTAPKRWFNEPGVDTSDVIPESWVKIEES